MFTLIVFIISLILILVLIVIRNAVLDRGRGNLIFRFYSLSDSKLIRFSNSVKVYWSHVNFKNTKLIFSWITASIRKLVVKIKRRFDHKQSSFFIKREYENYSKKKGSVSFFLKNISDHKKNLREGKE